MILRLLHWPRAKRSERFDMTDRATQSMTRRRLLRHGAVLAGGAILLPGIPAWARPFSVRQQAATANDPIAKMRAEVGAMPIERSTLTDRLTMLSGPGGNVVVLHGPDGKIVVDSFVQTAWDKLKQTLDGIDASPVKTLIDTHWHFDHTDNNANFRKAGAAVVAHQNTRKRLGETHELLGMRFTPAPPDAMPSQTFKDRHTITANGEEVALGYIPPSHTDTDIYIRFSKANVLHLGDVFFNGIYPFIDAGTGGSINGMISGADMALKMADPATKIVPGHGPLADRAALTKYRDMLVTVRDRVQKLKSAGRKLEEVVKAAPTADLDPTWGQGFMPPAMFVGIVYNTLR
jgi:glyoxylase-like metal-dependent hydrolase (beta-lactamase superfamily II)